MENYDFIILAALFDIDYKPTFRQLHRLTNISPNTLRKRLDELRRRKLVHEEGRNVEFQQLKGYSYSLTDRGKDEYLRQAVSNAKRVLEMLHRITTTIKGEDLERYHEYMRKHHPAIDVSGPYSGTILLSKDDSCEKEMIRDAFDKLLAAVCYFDIALNTSSGSRELNDNCVEGNK
jgi:DNA-binding HxlR family transcriptional regulator